MIQGDEIDSGEESIKDAERKHQWDPTASVLESPGVFRDLVLLAVATRQMMHFSRLVNLYISSFL